MEDKSGMRRVHRWKILLAHDASASTCNPLIDAIEGALGTVDTSESSSVDDARVALRQSHFDLAMVCLDLPPAPLGGVRLAEEIVAARLPLILVTRSLRWIPPSAVMLRDLPWITPDASIADVSRSVVEALRPPSEPIPSERSPRPGLAARAEDRAVRRARWAGGA